MAFISFPYFWCIRVSLIQRLSIPSEFTLTIVLTVNFCILLHCRTDFSFKFKRPMLKSFSDNFFKLINSLFRDRYTIWYKLEGTLLISHFYGHFVVGIIIELYYVRIYPILSCTVFYIIYVYKYLVAKLWAYLLLCIN